MIVRRFMGHLREQNWFAVGLDVIVVILGVYLGLYIGQAAEKQALSVDIYDSMKVVHKSLQEDLIHLDDIIAAHKEGEIAFERQVVALAPEAPDVKSFEALNARYDRYNMTFFPNRSAYQMLRDQGFLMKLEDQALQLKIINLYERSYDRLDMNSLATEESFHNYYIHVRDLNWNRIDKKMLLPDDLTQVILLRNGVESLRRTAISYRQLMQETFRPKVVELIGDLDHWLEVNT